MMCVKAYFIHCLGVMQYQAGWTEELFVLPHSSWHTVYPNWEGMDETPRGRCSHCIVRDQRTNRSGLDFQISRPITTDPTPPPRLSLPSKGLASFPNSVIKWGPSIQSHELINFATTNNCLHN